MFAAGALGTPTADLPVRRVHAPRTVCCAVVHSAFCPGFTAGYPGELRRGPLSARQPSQGHVAAVRTCTDPKKSLCEQVRRVLAPTVSGEGSRITVKPGTAGRSLVAG